MALTEGETAPDFTFINQEGEQINFHSIDGTKIVFFFPQAFTAGCTAQACSLRDNYSNLREEGVKEVFGISIDSEDKIEKFKMKHGLDYIMIADEDGEISKKYDVYNNFLLKKLSGRVTYTVNDENKITNVINSGIMGHRKGKDLSEHGEEIIDFLKM